MKQLTDFFINENAYADFDYSGAVDRLSKAIQCKTVNFADHSLTDFSAFDELQAHMQASYPNVFSKGKFELVGHSVLIEIPGTDPNLLPSLYMSHQDVVPVVKGTEDDWSYPAYSGAVAEGYIWGRGTLDIKEQVFGALEAAEYLLSKGHEFRRTAYLAFGDDEETLNQGAQSLAELLQSRGVRLEFVLDEGGGSIEMGDIYGAPDTYISVIDTMEKGYADLELSTESIGGHSSKPFGGTSLQRLSTAIAQITAEPMPIRLSPVMVKAMNVLKPYITEEPLKSLCEDVEGNAQAIADYMYTQQGTFPFVTTTMAPTMIMGSSAACNVMPQNMQAVINFRIAEGETVEDVLQFVKSKVTDERVSMRFLQANDPSAVARTDGFGYNALLESLGRFYEGVVFIPSMTVGATDAHHYEIICDTCLRCSPFMAEREERTRGVHGTNERILVRAYEQGIRMMIDLMEHANL